MAEITLAPLTAADREQFILDNQEAFNYGALEEFGRRDDHFEEEGEIISRQVIEASIDGGEAYRILADGQPVGGAVIKVEGDRGDLELLGAGAGSSFLRRRLLMPLTIRNTTSATRMKLTTFWMKLP